MRLLVTGGAGYIGAHVVIDLLRAGHDVVVLDDLSTGHADAVVRAQELAGRPCTFVQGDIANGTLLRTVLEGVDAVVHLAAFKMVGESMDAPGRYFRNNIGGMAQLLETMDEVGVQRIVYSSSAAVYGSQGKMPVPEDVPLTPESPYGCTKAQGEQMLQWMADCRGWSVVSLRYFNPVGAHDSGRIGQPIEGAASLVPRALLAVVDPSRQLTVFGTDYPTADGTALRDYIHVCDLSRAHLNALSLSGVGHQVFNVGTGKAHSVREVLSSCQRATGKAVPHRDGPRRAGDIHLSAADPRRFQEATGFIAERGLDDMVASAWRWMELNPRGYAVA